MEQKKKLLKSIEDLENENMTINDEIYQLEVEKLEL